MKQDFLAENLRKIREDRNLSLDNLSELTGVSKSMLRQIEIGQSHPTITTIWKIANGLKIPFTLLFHEQHREVQLHSFKQNDPLTGTTSGYRLFPLISFTPEHSFEMYYVEIDHDVEIDAEPHQGNAEEYVFVVGGEITITVNNSVFLVSEGNYISFQADNVHKYKNNGTKMTAALMLISYLF